jgi:hypothetical protein
MFASNTKLKAVEKQYFDLSQHPATSGNANYTFIGCSSLLIVEDIGMPAMSNYSGTYQGCYSLHTIEKIRCNEDTVFNSTFINCRELQNITIEGSIGKSGFYIESATKLSKDSITNIINALSTTSSGKVMSLSLTAVNKAFETSSGANNGSTSDEWEALKATKTNWTISLA